MAAGTQSALAAIRPGFMTLEEVDREKAGCAYARRLA
jgi:hypothetical protein